MGVEGVANEHPGGERPPGDGDALAGGLELVPRHRGAVEDGLWAVAAELLEADLLWGRRDGEALGMGRPPNTHKRRDRRNKGLVDREEEGRKK